MPNVTLAKMLHRAVTAVVAIDNRWAYLNTEPDKLSGSSEHYWQVYQGINANHVRDLLKSVPGALKPLFRVKEVYENDGPDRSHWECLEVYVSDPENVIELLSKLAATAPNQQPTPAEIKEVKVPDVIIKRLQRYLAEKKKSKGGLAPVHPDEIKALADIVLDLVEAKYQKDPDGDVPINIGIVDRTKARFGGFKPIPYDHKDALGYYQACLDNLATATREMEIANKVYRTRITLKPEEPTKKED